MEDYKNGEMFSMCLSGDDRKTQPLSYQDGGVLSPASVTQFSNEISKALTNMSLRPRTDEQSTRVGTGDH